MASESRRGAGGTSGGLGEFIVGALLTFTSVYLILSRVTLTTGFWNFGGHAFGVMLIPLIAGVAALFNSLTILLVMVGTMAAGLGLIFKSLRPH